MTKKPIRKIEPTAMHQSRMHIAAMACAPNGNTIAVANRSDRYVYLIDLVTGREVGVLEGRAGIPRWLEFSGSGGFIAISYGGGFEIWEAESQSIVHTVRHVGAYNCGLAFSPSNKYLYAASDSPEGSVRRIDLESFDSKTIYDIAESNLLPVVSSKIETIALSPEGERLAISIGTCIILFDLALQNDIRVLEDPAGGPSVEFSPDGQILATLDRNLDLRLWNISTGEMVCNIPTNAIGFEFHPERKLILVFNNDHVGSPTHLEAFDISSGNSVLTFKCSENSARFAFIPGTNRLVTGSIDGSIAIWDLSNINSDAEAWGHSN